MTPSPEYEAVSEWFPTDNLVEEKEEEGTELALVALGPLRSPSVESLNEIDPVPNGMMDPVIPGFVPAARSIRSP